MVINGRVNWKCRINILPYCFIVQKVIGDSSTTHFLILDLIREVGDTQVGYFAQKNQTFIEQFSYENQIELLFHKKYNLVGGRTWLASGHVISQIEFQKNTKIFSPMILHLFQYLNIVGNVGNKPSKINFAELLEPKKVKS